MPTKNGLAIGAMTLLCLVATAAGQFEVSPDHPDEPVAKKASPQRAEVAAKIAEQQKILESCQIQIRSKSQEVEAALQDLIANGNEGGQAEALWIRERELEKLQKRLASEIRSAEATLASLQNRLGTLAAQTEEPVPGTVKPHPAKTQRKPRPAGTLRASARARQ